MKQTLTISLLLALGGAAMAQNPATVRNNTQAAVGSTAQVSVAAKPAATPAKVVSVSKPAITPKPAVVAAKPVVIQAKPVTVSKPASAQVKTATTAVKPAPAAVKPATAAVKPATAAVKPAIVAVKPAAVAVKPAGPTKSNVIAVQPVQNKAAVQAKPTVAVSEPVTVAVPGVHPVTKTQVPIAPKVISVTKTDSHKPEKQPVVAVAAPDTKAANNTKADDKKPNSAPEQKSVAQNGRRDPFVSPIVTVSSLGSGCSSGKRCLAIDQINLKGIVKSDTGMIAVVVNAAEKAYFLRENDPVFNGYVVKITGDSIVFKESFHDKLGKPLTRDVTKTISRPVA